MARAVRNVSLDAAELLRSGRGRFSVSRRVGGDWSNLEAAVVGVATSPLLSEPESVRMTTRGHPEWSPAVPLVYGDCSELAEERRTPESLRLQTDLAADEQDTIGTICDDRRA